jgi:hypothetical protein
MADYYIHRHNKEIIDNDGKIIFFPKEQFEKEIIEEKHCFICGASPLNKEFNDEHVIPDWILRKYNLHNRQITLPNLAYINYSQYKVPCCKECNSLLSQEFELPISKIIDKGYNYFSQYLKNEGPWLIFRWLSLIFFKTHLKDLSYRYFQDRRQPNSKISDFYFWESMHHIHCIARSFYTGAVLDSKVLGSLLILPVRNDTYNEPFDYGDNFDAKSIMLKLGEIGIVAILNDSCGSLSLFMEELNKITAPVASIQLREMLSRLSYINLNLKERPVFFSSFNKNKYSIEVDLPDFVEFYENGNYKYGDILYSCCKDILNILISDDKDIIIQKIKEGRYSFLFDNNGNFIKAPIIFQ